MKISFEKNVNANKKYGFLGLPWDQGDVNGIPGCRMGPDAIRPHIASVVNKIENNKLLDCERWEMLDASDLAVKDFGNADDFRHYDWEYSYDYFCRTITDIAKAGYNPLIAGGDCGINYASVKGLHDSTNEYIGVIYMDAHPDIWQNTEKIGKLSHSCPVVRINELERVRGNNIVHFGLRSYRGADAQEDYDYMTEKGVTVVTYRNFRKMGLEKAAEKMIDVVTKNTGKVALAIDIDVMEQAFAPGSSYTVPCGPDAWEMHELIKLLAPHVDCMSISEVNKMTDNLDQTAKRAGRLFLDYIVNNYAPEK